MSLHRTRPNENRTPEFIELPDGRKRLTRFFDLPNGSNLTDALVEAYGTVDVGPATGTTAGFAGLRLVDQRLVKINEQSYWQKTYEELPATAELQVGGATVGNTRIKLPDGRTAYEAEFLQLVAGTYTAGTVGATTAPGDTAAYLQKEEATNDGALRRIKRSYVTAGTIQVTNETKNNGALLLRTIVSVKTVPSTPSGYTLIATRDDPSDGLVIYTYTFAKGTGEISREENFSNSTGQGLSGLAITTIRYLVAPSAGVQPTTYSLSVWNGVDAYTDIAGSLISSAFSEADGHRIWTTSWATLGTDFTLAQHETKHNGALLLTTYRSLGTTPTTPSGYTLVSTAETIQDGVRIYTYTYAKGAGEISRDLDYSQSSDEGATGLTRTTIRYLVAPSATVQPTTLAGSVLIGKTVSEADGHRIWTTVWAKGTGLVLSNNRVSNNGKLVVYTRTALGSAPSAPAATIGGTVVSTLTGYRETEGFKVYDYEWAEGVGTLASDQATRNNGKLVIYRRRALGAAPSAPAATIGGTVTLTNDDSRDDSGVTIYDRTWAEGKGLLSKQSPRELGQGLRMETWISLGATYDAAFMLPAGILRFKDDEELDGTKRWTVSCIQNAAGASPLAGTTVASYDVASAGDYYFSAVPTVTVSGGGGSSATGTAVLSGGTTGYLTSITLGAAGTGYTSPPLVTVTGSGSGSTLPTAAAVLSGLALSRERLVKFRYPGRAQAVSLAHPDVTGSANLEIQLSPFIDTELIGTEEISYRADNSLSDLANPLWAPTEWATIFAQYVSPNGYPVSRCEGLRDYRAVGGVSAISQSYGAVSLVTVLGNETGYLSGKKAYLKVFGGPDAPDGKVFTLEAECDLAFIAYDGTKYYRRTVVYAAIPQQAAMPALMTTIVMISTTVTSIATLKAVTTVGATVGGRTNAFTYTFTQGGTLFTRQMMGTLTSGALAADTLFLIKPTDYSGGTPLYWTLS